MNQIKNLNYNLSFIRGATTSLGNTKVDIEDAVKELIDELIKRNEISAEKILSITFTVTRDLNACFPASIARKYNGLQNVAFLDCQQMYVPNDIKHCIRLMAVVILPLNVSQNHPYLREASKLRPDRC
ncbi:MAG: chorismate mutase [Prochlorococcus sp. SP3034]|nr:chorismate mutase [Prochlorococcus sp. SP3034]|tara:strand:+ start:107 stop:490 length:384 start_codon:yes stop_codon:yes gene_type:complete